ncbi:hypothetical protein [Flavobacterium sp.]|uniref:hypothetical protein n=1 Tax=Flavobacterium sp. TaxID=239 RepID=UPI00261E48AB|nr:hypothetical protein [Flavobacterium sp.]MDD2986428.1 hypothetical protein [Flavobacterium sp.]
MDKHSENIKILIHNVKDKIGKPVSSRVVAATIESFGIRDIDTDADFGVSNIQDLSIYVYKQLTTAEEHKDSLNLKEREFVENNTDTIQLSDYMVVKAKIFAQYYSLGIFHLLPVVLQIAAIVVFGYSLWTHVHFNHLQSTAVVLGVMIGIITSGGFVQVIGRQASFYWNYHDYAMTKKTINYLLKLGIKSLFIIFSIICFINVFIHIYPFKVLLVVFMYAFFVGTLLLLLAPLHTIKQRWMITVAVILGTLMTVALNKFTTLHIYYTHWIGIAVAIIITKLYLYFFFRNYLKIHPPKANLSIKTSVFIYQNHRYFLYGLFVYFFIFIDRILAWSANTGNQLPFMVYFEKDYELGMDLAILVFLLLAGVLEFSIASFTRFLDITQKLVQFEKPKNFNNELHKLYWQNILVLVISGLLIYIFIYQVMFASWGYKGQFNEDLESISVTVCFLGGTGYFFLAWGMLNTLYLFTLGESQKPLKGIIYAIVINITIGFLLSRFLSFEYSVVGMLIGSLFFMLYTLKNVFFFFKKLDYHYYAAF